MENPVVNYTDKSGRLIIIGGEGNNIVAEHNGKQVGKLEFDTIDDGNDSRTLLTHCEVDSKYRRCGIAKEMLKLGEEWYDDFLVVDHLATEGAAVLNYCKSAGIFQKDHNLRDEDRY